MDTHFPFLTSMLALVFFSTTLPQSHSQKNDSYSTCSKSFSCGTLITNVSYPFWGGNRPQFCGGHGFKLTCMHNQNTSIQVGSQKFNVININQTASTMRVVRTDLVYDSCSSNFTNTSLSGSPFSFLPTVQNVTIFYECPSWGSIVGNSTFTCRNDSNKHAFYVVNGTEQVQQFSAGLQNCGVRIQVQVSKGVVWDAESGVDTLKKALDQGFDVKYDAGWSSQCSVCRESGGTCGTNEKQNGSAHFSCYCPSGTHDAACPTHKSNALFLLFSYLLHFVGLYSSN